MREKLEKDREHVVRESRSARSWESKEDGGRSAEQDIFPGMGR